ncbi:MAG TPA: CorA family divalent cation transporter [Roseiarcus sp.]|nr:CorA family divalent cation transporter [Roseiarcus sp.]
MAIRPEKIEPADVGPGVAWVFEFDEDGCGHPLPPEAPLDLMHGRRFVWAHLVLANTRTREWLSSQDAIPEDARDALLSPDAHPRLDWSGDALWGTLYDMQREFDSVIEEPTDLRFALRPQFLVTARRHPVRCADELRTHISGGAVYEDSASLFERMLASIADSVGAAAHKIAERLDSIEDRVLSESFSDESASLSRLRRAISRQERLIQAAQSVLGQLEQHRGENALPAYRDLAHRVRQRVASFHADLHLQGDRARLLQDEMAAQLASATNRNLFVLTLVTTVLLPPAFVTGFFGMNTKGLPFAESDNGTLYAALLCAVAAGVVLLLIRRFRMLG